jgi:hypothetical protein
MQRQRLGPWLFVAHAFSVLRRDSSHRPANGGVNAATAR